MNIKKSSKISNGVNYNNLSKLNLRRRNNFQDNKTAWPIFRLAFLFERSALNPVRDKSLNGVN